MWVAEEGWGGRGLQVGQRSNEREGDGLGGGIKQGRGGGREREGGRGREENDGRERENQEGIREGGGHGWRVEEEIRGD